MTNTQARRAIALSMGFALAFYGLESQCAGPMPFFFPDESHHHPAPPPKPPMTPPSGVRPPPVRPPVNDAAQRAQALQHQKQQIKAHGPEGAPDTAGRSPQGAPDSSPGKYGWWVPNIAVGAPPEPEATGTKLGIFIEKGSVWDNDKGQQLIGEEINEARRIWVDNGGVKLPKPDPFTVVAGDPNKRLKKGDLEKYAQTHGAKADQIVVVFRNQSVSVSRAYTHKDLVKNDTPVIIVGKEVFKNPGTKRDLAHEVGHVLLRTEEEISYGWRDDHLRRQGTNIGDYVDPDDLDKARKYPNNK